MFRCPFWIVWRRQLPLRRSRKNGDLCWNRGRRSKSLGGKGKEIDGLVVGRGVDDRQADVEEGMATYKGEESVNEGD